MKKLLTILILLFLTVSVSACTVNIDNFELNLRSYGDYDTSIVAEDNDEIDIKVDFDTTNVSGSDCDDDISVRARIYRWDEDDDEWDYYKSTTTKRQGLEEDSFEFTWTNDFTIDDRYDEYKVEATISEDNDELEQEEAFIEVVDNSCSGITIETSDFRIDEGEREERNFYIENNTNTDFEIDEIEVYFSNSLVTEGSVDYDTIVRDGDREAVSVDLEAGYTSYDRTTEGTFAVSGYLDGEYCSSYEIGREKFDVEVENTGSSSGSSSSSNRDCDEIRIKARDFEINENDKVQEIFYIENNSTKRFEIEEVEVIDSGLDVQGFYLERYAFPGSIADIVIESESGNVTSNKSYENTIKVRGEFSDGKTCSFSSINEEDFYITVVNTSGAFYSNCEGFNISVQDSVEITNYGNIEVSISNNTNKKASVFIEGINGTVSPSIIILPENTTISRNIAISMENSYDELILRPEIDGCSINSKIISINNTATGQLASVEAKAEIRRDINETTLILKFNNPTNKTFVGILEFDLKGQIINDRTLAISPGESFHEVELGEELAVGKVKFTSSGQSKEIEVNEGEVALTGLFAFGGTIGIIGLILLIIVIIIAIIVVITEPKRRIREQWEIKKQ
jgi:hypothetical protein